MVKNDEKNRKRQSDLNDEENLENEIDEKERPEEREEPYFREVDIPGDEDEPSPEETPTGFVLVDQDTEDEGLPLQEEEVQEFLEIDTNEEAVMEEIDDYTTDDEIEQDFSERQRLTSGSEGLLDELRQHHSKKPDLSGGDLDAAWQDMDVAGEEGVGATNPTPDQDVVDELGDAYGIDYEDDEPLQTEEKLLERDRNRWELDPASAEQEEEDEEDEESE